MPADRISATRGADLTPFRVFYSKSIFDNEVARRPVGATLLRVDLGGRATPLWNQRGSWQTRAIAAPSGRELAPQHPDAFLPYLARSLGAKAAILQRTGNATAAATAFHEGIQSLKFVFLRLPEVFTPLMTGLLRGYVQACKAAGLDLTWPCSATSCRS